MAAVKHKTKKGGTVTLMSGSGRHTNRRRNPKGTRRQLRDVAIRDSR